MDLGDWLRGLGLGQYEDVFLKNEIDGSVLPYLTEGDFEKFGVPMGHRKRLLKAIANFGTIETSVQPESNAPSTSTDGIHRYIDGWELTRALTVPSMAQIAHGTRPCQKRRFVERSRERPRTHAQNL